MQAIAPICALRDAFAAMVGIGFLLIRTAKRMISLGGFKSMER